MQGRRYVREVYVPLQGAPNGMIVYYIEVFLKEE